MLFRSGISASHLLLAMVVMFAGSRNHFHLTKTVAGIARHVIAGWVAISGALFLFGWLTGTLTHFDQNLLKIWWYAAPITQLVALALLRKFRPMIARIQGPRERAVVVGINEQGVELARRMSERPTHLNLIG